RFFMRIFPGVSAAVESFRFPGDCVSSVFARHHRFADASARSSLDQSLLESLGRLPHQHCADRSFVCFPAASGMADVRRNRARALPTTDLAKETARMGF